MDSDDDVDWIEIRAPAGSLGLKFGDGPVIAQIKDSSPLLLEDVCEGDAVTAIDEVDTRGLSKEQCAELLVSRSDRARTITLERRAEGSAAEALRRELSTRAGVAGAAGAAKSAEPRAAESLAAEPQPSSPKKERGSWLRRKSAAAPEPAPEPAPEAVPPSS